MKRIFSALLFLACSAANAQFVTGQILTAARLNAAFANVLATSGGTLTGPLTVQGSTTLTNLTVNGTFTVPGGFSPGSLSPQAANSLLGNSSGTTAAPSVIAVPSCSASGSALKWTSATGPTCGTGYALTASPLSQFAATTSAQLANVVSDESGSGSLLFGTSPTIATPAITGGTISGTPISGGTGSFTTLAASSTVSGAGFTSLLSPYLTTSTAASTYATIAQATTALAATGGSINGVTQGLTTPAASKVTTLVATGLITPTSTIGIAGTATNDSPATGSVGETITAQASAVAITASTATTVVSIPVTAGNWSITGSVQALAAAGTVVNAMIVGPSTTTNAFMTQGGFIAGQQLSMNPSAGFIPTLSSGEPINLKFATTTTVYLVAQINYATSTCTANARITATRVR